MEMADNPKLDMACSSEAGGVEESLGTQKISVLDHVNGLQYAADKSDSFVIDMESFSHGSNKDMHANSRITLQRNLSRKGVQRGVETKKINNPNSSANDRETTVATSSPRGPGTPENAAVVAIGTPDYSSNSQIHHHQITVTTSNINASTEGKFTLRRNSFKRSPASWVLDPKRVLFLFATLSSMGTILLIYLTLAVGKVSPGDNALG